MSVPRRDFWKRLRGLSGQSMTEYALVLLLIAVIALAVLTAVGVGTTNHLGSVNQNMR